MTPIAITLILCSAVMHAGWNLISKRSSPTTAFFMMADSLGYLCFAPLLLVYWHIAWLFPTSVWLLLGATGLCQSIYYCALAGAYRAGDMSIAYPLARSSPLIVVTVVTMLLGHGSQVSGQCIIGIVLVVLGALILPMRRFNDLNLRNYINLSCLLALGAAFGTAGYTIVDDYALQLVRGNLTTPADLFYAPIVYVIFEGLSTSLWMGVLLLWRRHNRHQLRVIARTRWRQAALTGAGIHVTYALVLISMGFVDNVSYVAAFRQISIPLGVLLGVLILQEAAHPPKFVGVTTMFAGLVLVATG